MPCDQNTIHGSSNETTKCTTYGLLHDVIKIALKLGCKSIRNGTSSHPFSKLYRNTFN